MPDVSGHARPDHQRTCRTCSAPCPPRAGGRRGRSSTSSRSSRTTSPRRARWSPTSPPSEADWDGEKYVMEKVGYKVVYDQTFADHPDRLHPERHRHEERRGQDALHRADARELRLGCAEGPRSSRTSIPTVILGASTYSNQLVSDSGGAVGGQRQLPRPERLALPRSGTPRRSRRSAPSSTGCRWPRPGFQPDLFTLYGWMSGELFAQALQNAGSNPSRGSLLQSLSKITTFTGGNIDGHQPTRSPRRSATAT